MRVLVSVCTVRTECLRSCCVAAVGGRGVCVRSAQQCGHSRSGLPEKFCAPKEFKTLVFLGVGFLEGALVSGKPGR